MHQPPAVKVMKHLDRSLLIPFLCGLVISPALLLAHELAHYVAARGVRGTDVKLHYSCVTWNLSGEDLSGRIGGGGISAFGFGPGTLRLESPFQPCSEAETPSKIAGSTPSGKSLRPFRRR